MTVLDFGTALARRTVRLPITGIAAADRRAVYQLAELLERGAEDAALEIVQRAVQGALATLDALESTADDPQTPKPDEATAAASLRFGAVARALLDLWRASWDISVDSGQVFAASPKLADVRSRDELVAAKAALRSAMSARVREQVEARSTARLVSEVEPAIRTLIADPASLSASLRLHGAEAIRPYLQTARRGDGDDAHTGLPLYSIFRYLRFWWSFPFGNTPGRSLPILIRDAGQPGHPVCGLLCFASPVLRLTDRDDALGLTPAWLEAFVAALDVDAANRREALAGWAAALRRLARNGLSSDEVSRALARALGVDASGDADDVFRRVRQLPATRWDVARGQVARMVATDLVDDLSSAIHLISFDGLNLTVEEALAGAQQAGERLAVEGAHAREAWEVSRRKRGFAKTPEGKALLYRKKRTNQLSGLLLAWADLAAVREALALDDDMGVLRALRVATSRRAGAYAGEPLQAGARCSRGVSEAILARKVTLASSRIADVSVCGAVPPYDAVLGGKLAALMALSREAAALYHRAYDGVASHIQSEMAGVEVRRSAELAALTTTSLYGVGSSQYNRCALPAHLGGQRWAEVGRTAGHGTMHFSETTVVLAYAAYALERGADLITGGFGEGPSERMRKLRDGLSELGFPADELLKHGMERISYVCAFVPLHAGAGVHRGAGLSAVAPADHIAKFWRERWASPRLASALERIPEFNVDSVLLSTRFPAELARARAAPDHEAPDVEADIEPEDNEDLAAS